MARETPLQKIEQECRSNSMNGRGPESLVHSVSGHEVQVKMSRAYTPRNTFSSDHVRFSYYVDGRRVAYSKAWDMVNG